MDHDKILAQLAGACPSKPGVQTELSAERVLYDVTKFNGEGIFQNLSEDRFRVKARVVKEGRLSEASAEGILEDIIGPVLKQAEETAVFGREVPAGYRFPEPEPLPRVETFFESTSGMSPLARAEQIRDAVAAAEEPGVEISGSLHLLRSDRFLANTSGIRVAQKATEANLNFVAESDSSRGYSGQACRNVDELDIAGLAREAGRRCAEARNPRELPPGDYETVFLPNALADLTPFLGMLVFSALSEQEGRSCISGRLGQQVVSPLVNIWDDATDSRGLAEAFDAEGVPKRRMELIRAGAPLGFAHDSLTAARTGTASTGHAFPATKVVYGPITANLFMGPGEKSLDELISEVKRGVLITKLHYVRCLDAKTTRVGGVTAGGTFFIDNGRIAQALPQLRFSVSIMELLGRVNGVGRELLTTRRQTQGPGPISIYPSAFTLPAIRVESFGLSKAD